MNYLKISPCSLCDGLGIRTVLWVSGCTHQCKGCHNQCSWDYTAGRQFDTRAYDSLLECLDKPYIKGLTLSGGDPLSEKNILVCTYVARTVKELFPNKDIWCYTGFLWEDVMFLPIMKYIDFLVDGEFVNDLKDTTLAFRGSSNQRIIDVNANKELIL